MRQLNDNIQGYEEKIAAETRKLESDTREKREATTQRLEKLEAQITIQKEQITAVELERRQYDATKSEAERTGRQYEKDKNAAQEEYTGTTTQLGQLHHQKKNAMSAFGTNLPQVLDQISHETWSDTSPIGPLGMHVELLDHRWADLMRRTIGSLMFAWAVGHSRDRVKLCRILEQCGKFVIGIELLCSTTDCSTA